jgi:hypothetical protein
MTSALQDLPPFAGHSPDRERPLGGYGILLGTYMTGVVVFGAWLRAGGRELPERVDIRDLALITIATHKSARLITRDRVAAAIRAPFTRFQRDAGPGEVDEAARGHGLRRAVGELLVCPYCIAMWISTGFLGGLIVAPRPTRWIASSFVVLAGADTLQLAYSAAERAH